ncbi:TIGR02270 family protein [Bowmanella denitrificans]|uniref:TIGR02270 family protein n=1 Tax=Bowmanella denitrificans TaxID=366582 RepID=UPI000C9A752C|nr:TIGR02270 family protein [Bowmanella denitrificans]
MQTHTINTPQSRAIPVIVDRHAEDAAFLWLQWTDATCEPHYTLNDLIDLEERLNSHLNGLRLAGDQGIHVAKQQVTQHGEPGEIFVAVWLLCSNWDGEWFDKLLNRCLGDPDTYQALLYGLAWSARADTLTSSLLSAKAIDYQLLGLLLAEQQCKDPGNSLSELIQQGKMLPALIGAAGKLDRRDLLSKITSYALHQDPQVSFKAKWSASLLGDWSAVAQLAQHVLQSGPGAWQGMSLLARRLSPIELRNLLETLSENAHTTRLAIQGMGYSGDPFWLPVILKHMHDLNLARVAGEAFSLITGLDLAYLDMDRDWPEGFESGPNEDPLDDNVELDADLNLPWPDSAKIQEWWQANAAQFTSGQRYLCGKPINKAQCYQVLKNGYQRQRHAAALELALMGEPYFNVCAPAKRQKALLDAIPDAD